VHTSVHSPPQCLCIHHSMMSLLCTHPCSHLRSFLCIHFSRYLCIQPCIHLRSLTAIILASFCAYIICAFTFTAFCAFIVARFYAYISAFTFSVFVRFCLRARFFSLVPCPSPFVFEPLSHRDVAGRFLPRWSTLLGSRLYEQCAVSVILGTLHEVAYR
jgi:hypothetical protein